MIRLLSTNVEFKHKWRDGEFKHNHIIHDYEEQMCDDYDDECVYNLEYDMACALHACILISYFLYQVEPFNSLLVTPRLSVLLMSLFLANGGMVGVIVGCNILSFAAMALTSTVHRIYMSIAIVWSLIGLIITTLMIVFFTLYDTHPHHYTAPSRKREDDETRFAYVSFIVVLIILLLANIHGFTIATMMLNDDSNSKRRVRFKNPQ